ncbi:MAG TPA: 16S rRNA processing protein RimM, partial [Nannocystis exedens]|nr:16S rRNA processing protein RimM [Nannocystis exedens]
MTESKRTLVVARVTAPHGIRGGLRAKLYDPKSTSLEVGRQVQLGSGGPTVTVDGFSAVPGKDFARLRLRGVCSRDEAEALRGCELLVHREDLPPLREDEFYLADAIGLPVERLDQAGQVQALGTIVALTSNRAQDLFEIEWTSESGGRKRWLLPVVPQLIESLSSERLRVDLPLGMLPTELETDSDEGEVEEEE